MTDNDGTVSRVNRKTRELLKDQNGNLPVWIRAPERGTEFYSGLTRPKLYELAGKRHIRSVSLREEGQVRGCRLFHLQSIFHYFEKCEAAR